MGLKGCSRAPASPTASEGLDPIHPPRGVIFRPLLRGDCTQWPRIRGLMTERFATRTRDEWTAIVLDLDACVTPVLDYVEASEHPHLRHRRTVMAVGDVPQSAPAPRFSRTASPAPRPPSSERIAPYEVVRRWADRDPISGANLAATSTAGHASTDEVIAP